ncbi:YtpR family tRNA-binding protein [Psychrobacillus sp. FSL H8-0484]|uniref:YtpR family tRNA-binding protein n=1 Tax=Psychrobacillus sp. FSL H8-0484 TaxID=2921390 RepID=UPI0030FA68A4
MNIFYNEVGVGDVLLVQLTPEKTEKVITESKGDVTLVKDAQSNEVLAINVFGYSKYDQIQTTGQVSLTEELVAKVQHALAENGVSYTFEVDLSPKFVVGYVESLEQHPNADKLKVCQVNVGDTTLQIVCGAPNVEAGQKVVVAKVGAVMPSGMVIKDAELRGIASSGMLCSAKELALPNAPEVKGILILDEQQEAGSPFPQS